MQIIHMSPTKLREFFFADYSTRLGRVMAAADWSGVARLAEAMLARWRDGRDVYFCGNGGSAGNAIHLANDYLYGIAKRTGGGLRVHALPANAAVLTCLANDVGYEDIFSEQLAVLGRPGDLLIVLSGSGNSPNIVKVLEQAKAMHIESCAILGYSGGKCKELADIAIHFPVDDMQISEDLQLIVGHMLMQWLYLNPPSQ
jgi:D-sedoheptulose 7-phosphate isomerase